MSEAETAPSSSVALAMRPLTYALTPLSLPLVTATWHKSPFWKHMVLVWPTCSWYVVCSLLPSPYLWHSALASFTNTKPDVAPPKSSRRNLPAKWRPEPTLRGVLCAGALCKHAHAHGASELCTILGMEEVRSLCGTLPKQRT